MSDGAARSGRRPRAGEPPPWAFAFAADRLLLLDHDDLLRVPDSEELASLLAALPHDLTQAEVDLRPALGRASRAYDLPESMEEASGFRLMGLRSVWSRIPDPLFDVAGAALQKLRWLRTHGFCSRCGAATERDARGEVLVCTKCGHTHFPRLAPAVIVLIQRGREMLLARSPHFPEGMYSTVAGFVDPGESLEDAVRREIIEEVGVEVDHVRYFGSQPWPFPHSLMIGFVADWRSGEIEIDGDEIVDAGWFTPESLPPRLPSGLSIARRLVDDFLARVAESDGRPREAAPDPS